MKIAGLFALALTMVLVGCGKPSLGEECDTPAAADQCADDLVCGATADKATCQHKCFTSADCETNADCVPAGGGSEVDSDVLACRPR